MFASAAGFMTPNAHLKSLQVGTIDLNSVSSNTATISSVDVTNSVLGFHGFTINASTALPSFFPRLDLTNATTVTATSNNNGSNTRPVGYSVIEFYSGVLRSVQRGTVTLNGVTSNTATITSVGTTKTRATLNGFSFNSGGTNDISFYPRVALTAATTITVTAGTAPSVDIIASYQAEEYN